jgi:hypothetical protein
MFNLEQITYLAMVVAFSRTLGFLEPQNTRRWGDIPKSRPLLTNKMSQLSLRHNWFKFQIVGKLPIIFEEI